MKPVSFFACVIALTLPIHAAASQVPVSECHTYRAASTIVGAGLGAAIGAIPATVVHRHDQRTSHAIMAVSVSGGALTGLLASGRGHPCTTPSTAGLHDPVFARRESHAWKGALTGAVVGGIVGVAGGATLAGNGAVPYLGVTGVFAGGILGSLVGWAWPVHH